MRQPSEGSGLNAMLRVLSQEIPHIVGDLSPKKLLIGGALPASRRQRTSGGQTASRLPSETDAHDYVEVCCVISGKCMLRMGPQWIAVGQGQVCVLPPHTEHFAACVSSRVPYSLLWIPLDNETIIGHLAKYSRSAGSRVVFRVTCDSAISAPRLARDVLRTAAQGRRQLSALRFKACLWELCSLLLNQCLRMDAASQTNWGGKIVEEVMTYIRAHYPESPSLSEVSGHVHLSSCYLSSLFRKHSGQTMSGYLNSIRMKKAEDLLLGSRLSVKQIAAQTGFRSAHYFSRCFRRVHSVAPTRFREIHP